MQPDTTYTPDRIDHYLRDWQALLSQAESPAAPALVSTGAQPGKGGKRDHLRAAIIVADLERASLVLRVYGAQWNVVDHRKRGYTFEQIGCALRITKQTAWEHYQKALVRMAECLGWREVKEGE